MKYKECAFFPGNHQHSIPYFITVLKNGIFNNESADVTFQPAFEFRNVYDILCLFCNTSVILQKEWSISGISPAHRPFLHMSRFYNQRFFAHSIVFAFHSVHLRSSNQNSLCRNPGHIIHCRCHACFDRVPSRPRSMPFATSAAPDDSDEFRLNNASVAIIDGRGEIFPY
jgi:hypothetical protein